jgi:predicted Zn-dependent peptidase
MDVLLTYFGQGYRSRLTDELKNKQGLVQEAAADFVTRHDPGLISIVASAKPADISKAKEAIAAKLAQLSTTPIDSFYLDRAKRSLLGQYAFQNETVGGRAGTIGFYFAVADSSFAGKYEDAINAVTSDAVMQVAKKYLDPTKAATITVGPDQGGAQ